jgi:hypothetical protein
MADGAHRFAQTACGSALLALCSSPLESTRVHRTLHGAGSRGGAATERALSKHDSGAAVLAGDHTAVLTYGTAL